MPPTAFAVAPEVDLIARITGKSKPRPECIYVTNAADLKLQERFLRRFLDIEDALRGFVRSLVPSMDDARDVMQEVAAILWRKFNPDDSDEDFRRWAFGVARYEALALLRDRARDRHVFREDVLELLAAEAEKAAADTTAEAQALEQCLEKLLPAQRELVYAAYSPGIRIDDLAKAAGRSPMSVYKVLHRLRITLMGCIRKSLAQGARA